MSLAREAEGAPCPRGVPSLDFEVDARGIAILTLRRPASANALNPELLGALAERLESLHHDKEVRVVVLRGAGKHFCAGVDVRSVNQPGDNGPSLTAVCECLAACPQPTVAQVQGACLGGGLVLASTCDLLLASDDASFAIPEVRLGVAPVLVLARLRQALGSRQLARLALSGERIDADEALRIGLAHARVPSAGMAERLARVVDDLLLGGPEAQAAIKSTCAQLQEGRILDTAELQRQFARTVASPEGEEGRAAFMEKRPPRWFHARLAASEVAQPE